jgi:heavy metal sensor kinase
VRLTLWYTGVLAAILLVFALGVYFLLRNGLLVEARQRLNQDLAVVKRLVLEEPDDLEELEEHGTVLLFRVTEDDDLLYESPGWRRLKLDELLDGGPENGELTFETPAEQHFRVRVETFQDARHMYHVTVAYDEQATHAVLEQLQTTLLIGSPLALALAVLGGYVLASRMLAPVGAMASKAQRITADRLDERLPVENPDDEFGRLATVFNETLARLQGAFERLRRFTADASHELRTPLTALRSVGEVALRDHGDAVGHREAIGSMLEEVDRLTRLVDSLLMLTRADAGTAHLQREPLPLAQLVSEVVEHLRPLADEKSQHLLTALSSLVSVRADRTTLRQALINLLDNAIKYTPEQGEIRVRATLDDDGSGVVEVTDSGPGIPPEEHEKVFERFYRPDKARSREWGGAGLGLAIARWAVEANGGRVELESEVGTGSTFRIVLPQAPTR